MSDDNQNEETVSDETQQPEGPDTTPEVQAEPEQPKRRGRKPAKQEPVLDLGRMVRYVTASGTERPAVVTRINNGGAEGAGSVDLTVFNSQGAVPVTDVEHDSEFQQPHTWHWPEFN